jgi:hypothetical protein
MEVEPSVPTVPLRSDDADEDEDEELLAASVSADELLADELDEDEPQPVITIAAPKTPASTTANFEFFILFSSYWKASYCFFIFFCLPRMSLMSAM